MELRDCRPKQFVWWKYADDDRILCRVNFVGRDFVQVNVASATPEQCLRSGYAVGETVRTLPQSLEFALGGK
jgi:hypothetical protein